MENPGQTAYTILLIGSVLLTAVGVVLIIDAIKGQGFSAQPQPLPVFPNSSQQTFTA
jgi:hypothetical protein